MFTLGALAGPLPRGFGIGSFWKKTDPNAGICYRRGTRETPNVIMDFSAKPSDPRNSGPSGDDFTANTGYDRAETSCTFPDIRDKAAFVAAFGGGKCIAGRYQWECFGKYHNTKDVLHYQVVPLMLPGDSEVSYYVLMTNAMGTSGAPAGCVSATHSITGTCGVFIPRKTYH